MARRVRRGAIALVAAAALGGALAQPAAGWQIVLGEPAHLVVRNAADLSAADEVLRVELVDLGYSVAVVDDGAAVTATAETAVVVLSTSVEVAAVADAYKSVEAPLVALGNDAWPETGLTKGTNGLSYDTESLVVLDSTHPVASGLPTMFAPANAAGTLQSVNESFLPDGADPVAARAGELAKHVVYTVPAGAELGDESLAPAARVALGYTADTVNDLSAEGYQLLENAIFWADDTDATALLAAAPLVLQGRWNLDRIRNPNPGQEKTTPNSVMGSPVGKLDADTTVTTTGKVAAGGTGAFDFPGWRDESGTQQDEVVDGSDSSVRVPHENAFVPGATKRFRVTAFIRPLNTMGAGSPIDSGDTGNIVQKAFSNDPDGQWKMSLYGDMTPVCGFRGDTDNDDATPTVQRNVRAPSEEKLTAGLRYRIECTLTPSVVRLKVDRITDTEVISITNETGSTAVPSVFVIDNDEPVWFGKKPNDTTAADTFAGDIDNITIERPAL